MYFFWLDAECSFVFAVEVTCKIFAEGLNPMRYLYSKWNIYEGTRRHYRLRLRLHLRRVEPPTLPVPNPRNLTRMTTTSN